MQLGIGETAVVVDRDVQVLPPRAAAAVADLRAEDSFPERPEASELLDVDVQELARSGTLVAAHRPTDGAREAGATMPAQDLPHRRGWHGEQGGDDERTSVRVLAGSEDAPLELSG